MPIYPALNQRNGMWQLFLLRSQNSWHKQQVLTRGAVELAGEEEALDPLGLQGGVALVGGQVVVLHCRSGRKGAHAKVSAGGGSTSQLVGRQVIVLH